MEKDKKFLFFALLVLIIVISIFFRFFKLEQIPPGLYPDVAMNGNDALSTLENKDFKIFYPDNNGREGLYMWIIALSFSLFGASLWSIELVSAVFGVFTVLGVYLLSRQLFKKINENYELISLLSAFFIAISFWHVLFSRIGFRAVMLPFFLVYGFYFLYRGFEKLKPYNFIISGVFFGLGFYTYISYRFVALLGIIALASWFFVYKEKKKEFFKMSFWCVLSMFITALPIGIYFLKNPQDFFGRASGVSVLNDPNPFFAVIKSIIVHLGMFNFYGDANWRHNYSGSPQLLWPVGIFFIIGFVLSVMGIIKRKYFEKVPYILLISWFFIMLLACFLSSEGNPHALRAIGAIPSVYIFAGLGAFWFFKTARNSFKTKAQIIQFYAVVSIFLAILAYAQFNKYFYNWGMNKEVYGAFTQDYKDIGTYLNSLPDNIEKYVVVNKPGVIASGVPVPAQTPMFIERVQFNKTRAKYILAEKIKEIVPEKETIIVFMEYQDDLALETMILFPKGSFYDLDKFWVYLIPAEDYSEQGCGCSE